MKKRILNTCIIICAAVAFVFCLSMAFGLKTAKAANPYLPMWEHIPDGEPYVFEDPDNPGEYRLYVYGSHDIYKTRYCGDDLVVWSCPVDDLTDWRYDGVIFKYNNCTLYAPDIAVKEEADGTLTYYLYPNDQNGQRVIAKSKSPKGPFEPCAFNSVLGFDPAVFVDDDGRVYGYWGFQSSSMAELDPNTMCTIKSGARELKQADTGIDGSNGSGPYRFFEASSMRKIEDNGQVKYAFIYSRNSMNGEGGLGGSNATLAYAYSDNPLGPWTYGGFLIDARAREKNEQGNTIATFEAGNTHGSIVKVNDQWFVFYHRCINHDQYSRQGTAEAIDVHITDDGKLVIEEPEVTSEGLEVNGLNPYKPNSAGLMCYRIGNSTVKATYDESDPGSPVVDNRNGGIVGYKYFNFDKKDWQTTEFEMTYLAKGANGSVDIMIDSPWESRGGTKIGTIDISASDSRTEHTTKSIEVPELDGVSGKHGLYFKFSTSSNGDLLDIKEFEFKLYGEDPNPPTPTPAPGSEATPAPAEQQPAPAPVNVQPTANNTKPAAGTKISVGTLNFTVTAEGSEVSIAGSKNKKVKSVIIPATVVYDGVTYKVTGIAKNAFKNCKYLKKITIKTKDLKSAGKNCFKGIHKKAVIKVPAAKKKAYKKLLKGKGQKSTVKIK